MRKHLLDQKQPFGQVQNFTTMPGESTDPGYSSKSLGSATVHSNHGYVHGPGFGSQNQPAPKKDPFAPCGKAGGK